ncbi:MAG: hypothetical protein JXR13_17425 [Thalassovita sp.]
MRLPNFHQAFWKNGTFSIYRRIPKRFQSLELGQFYKKSLKTEDREVALQKADQIWQLNLAEWEALLKGRNDEAKGYHQSVVDIAGQFGFQYLPAHDISADVIATVLKRVEVVDADSSALSDAVLGAVNDPGLALSELSLAYEQVMASDNSQKAKSK